MHGGKSIPLFRTYEQLNKMSSARIIEMYEASLSPIGRRHYRRSHPPRSLRPGAGAIFAQIAGSDCSRNCSNFLNVSDKTIPKSTLSLHFKALREAGLIRGERRGVEMHNTSRCSEIDKRFPGLIAAIVNAHKVQSEQKPQALKAGKQTRTARGLKG
jgi:DNA-binding transcriptional ArsR family regulator